MKKFYTLGSGRLTISFSLFPGLWCLGTFYTMSTSVACFTLCYVLPGLQGFFVLIKPVDALLYVFVYLFFVPYYYVFYAQGAFQFVLSRTPPTLISFGFTFFFSLCSVTCMKPVYTIIFCPLLFSGGSVNKVFTRSNKESLF